MALIGGVPVVGMLLWVVLRRPAIPAADLKLVLGLAAVPFIFIGWELARVGAIPWLSPESPIIRHFSPGLMSFPMLLILARLHKRHGRPADKPPPVRLVTSG